MTSRLVLCTVIDCDCNWHICTGDVVCCDVCLFDGVMMIVIRWKRENNGEGEDVVKYTIFHLVSFTCGYTRGGRWWYKSSFFQKSLDYLTIYYCIRLYEINTSSFYIDYYCQRLFLLQIPVGNPFLDSFLYPFRTPMNSLNSRSISSPNRHCHLNLNRIQITNHVKRQTY